MGQSATLCAFFAREIAACLIRIFRKCGVKPFTRPRDWMNIISAVECIMLASRLERLCGAFLFAGLVTSPVVPACAQALSYGPDDSVAPAYQTPDADEAPTPALRRQMVDYSDGEPAGTIIIDPAHTFLYLTLGGGKAMRYGIGVGREGFEWSGVETIKRKSEWPDWIPPASMVARQPYLPRWVGGGPGNPLGARALYLGNTDYRIHGTNAPDSIGKHMSSGCIRMLNADVIDLYGRVSIGTKVIVLPDARARQISDAAPGTVTTAETLARTAPRKSGIPTSSIY
jgi:lipoprotein-anchoring transpeptidase ErfK/SrfK